MHATIRLRLSIVRNHMLNRCYLQKQTKIFRKRFLNRALAKEQQRNFQLYAKATQPPTTMSRCASTYLEKTYSKSVIEDTTLDFAGLARKNIYPVEEHPVRTADGYVLQLHRLPQPQGKPVLLMHGLWDSSDTWIIQGPSAGLGYYLYDLGYDVWMGNARGNFYSRNHVEKSPEKPSFWDFSWHEIGYTDLPAMIDYVLDKTAQKQLAYFGHSQGSTAFFVMASMRPEYNSKIRLMIALEPVAYMAEMKIPFEAFIRSIAFLIEDAVFEVPPRSNIWKVIFSTKTTERLFVKLMYDYLGAYSEMWNTHRLPAIAAHLASGVSIKQVRHYLQLKDSKRFCQYDYGKERNMERYGSATPPAYPLENITAPVALYYNQNDPLCNVNDVRTLINGLPNVIEDCMCPDKQWNHVTLIWGLKARELAHPRMVELLQKYE